MAKPKNTTSVSVSRIEVGKNGGTGILTSTTAGIAISTDSDFDTGEVGGAFASGPVSVTAQGTTTISNAASLNVGTGGDGDLDIAQTSASSARRLTATVACRSRTWVAWS